MTPAFRPHCKNVLILAYHFPPLAGAGAQRSLKFVRHLPSFGFRPIVVTGPARRASTWPPGDSSLTAEIPPGVAIDRLDAGFESLQPGGRLAPRLIRSARRLLRRPSPFSRAWVDGCVEIGVQAALDHGADLIYASMSPFETAEAAESLSRELDIPWVADLRDPWALDETMVYPTGWHRAVELRQMRAHLSSAALVIMNTPEASRALRETFPDLSERVVTITNGYDADDFRGKVPVRNDGVFRIVHTGHLHTALGMLHRKTRHARRLLGGERVAVDILTRSHIFLLRALSRWQQEDPAVKGRVELVLAGALRPEDRRVVESSPVRTMVRLEGYLAHHQSVALLRSADLLFLPMHSLPPGERPRIVPGKTYEYLAARRPILAAVGEGDVRDLVLASGMGDCCPPDHVEGMVSILKRRYEAFRAGEEPEPAREDFYGQFERRELTKQLVASFERVLAGKDSYV